MHLSTIEPNSAPRCHSFSALAIIARQMAKSGRTGLIEIHLEAARVAIGSVFYDKWPKKSMCRPATGPSRSKIATGMAAN